MEDGAMIKKRPRFGIRIGGTTTQDEKRLEQTGGTVPTFKLGWCRLDSTRKAYTIAQIISAAVLNPVPLILTASVEGTLMDIQEGSNLEVIRKPDWNRHTVK
jgi:hypothetical protein